MKIVFMGTPGFAVPALSALITAGYEIACVYTRAAKPAGRGHKEQLTPIHLLASSHNLPVETPKSLRQLEPQNVFARYQPDLAVIAAYGLILPQEILAIPRLGCINIHPSLLPRWRGAAPLQRTILAGDEETGICIMQMDEGLDTGDILSQEKFKVKPGTTTQELHDELATLGSQLLLKTIADLEHITPQKQNLTGITYANKLTKEEARLNWHKPSNELERLVRGLNPWPGAYFTYQNETIKILSANHSNEAHQFLPGTVLSDELKIACGQGTLTPIMVQRPGKKVMSVSEMLRGFEIKVGALLGPN